MSVRERWEDVRFRFLVIGAINTGFGYALFPLLFLLLGKRVHYLGVAILSHAIAVAIAFVLHRRYAFRAEGPWLPQYLRFNVGYLASFGIGLAGMALLVGRAHWSPLVAQPVLMTVTIVLSYLWHSRVSFRTRAK